MPQPLLFFQDWWNSTSFANYYRTWNVVVHDWLFYYGYRDFLWVSGLVPVRPPKIHHELTMGCPCRVGLCVHTARCGGPVSPVTQIPNWTDPWTSSRSLIPAAVEKEIPNSCHALRVHRLCARARVRPNHRLGLLLSRHVLPLCHHRGWALYLIWKQLDSGNMLAFQTDEWSTSFLLGMQCSEYVVL